eukprot:CAMPEP_0172423566 /NCGR_PEP_ID=MMETSP1064-20121228/17575_1 /TAXON_ID=202472 /ORGANISM="Aulacoseira subarctica , Strain CCAP 1002/5" /LENGTH=322 /DNA_ID=CAMNT_0013165003 /DNA_START=88 /DNA_END=1056 /DNA_ORIENTATION=-
MPNPRAEVFKNEGNAFFKKGQFQNAIDKYKQAADIDPSEPAYWSNMAACYEKIGNYEEMASASQNCIKADKAFVKGFFRLATAQKNLNDLSSCIKTLESGLAVQPTNPDLKKMKKDILELQRAEQVAAYCRKADEQMTNGDIAGAQKTLDLASRLDAGNADIARMISKVKPKFEAMEKRRKASLSATELYKERGDEKYKNADFEGAIELYTQCLEALRKEGNKNMDVRLKALSNRAACYKQISNFDGVISDCSEVLEIEPDNVKALVRRAQAFEGVERYRFALQDCKTVLSMPSSKIGESNYKLVNMMQHRLQKTVNQLKEM